jgi:hypothetical protein
MANTSNCRRLRGSWRDDRGRDLCRRSTSRACRENCNDDHTDCLCRGPRSGRRGACGKFQPTRWQRDRNHYGHRTTRAEAFGNTARASAQGSQYCDLVNPNTPDAVPEIRDVQAVAQINGFQITTLNATSAAELDEGFKILAENRPEALPVGSDPFFMSYSEQLAKFASQAKIPAIYPFRESNRRWRLDQLWDAYSQCLSPRRHSGRTCPQGREHRRPAGTAVNKIRTGYQSQSRQSVRIDCAAFTTFSCRRCDRLRRCGCDVRFWPLADILSCTAHVCFWSDSGYWQSTGWSRNVLQRCGLFH